MKKANEKDEKKEEGGKKRFKKSVINMKKMRGKM